MRPGRAGARRGPAEDPLTRLAVAFTATRSRWLPGVLESWQAARGIGDADLVFRVEPAGDPAVAGLCRSATFGASLTVIENPERLGENANPWHALDTAFAAGADFTVLAEDDTVVSSDVLEYFAWCRDEYAGERRVLAACAFQHHALPGGPDGVVLRPFFYSWAWGTWADRWHDVIRGDWDFDYARKGFDWHIREGLIRDAGKTAVFPCESRSQHVGLEGVHMRPDLYDQHASSCFERDRPAAAYREVH